MKNHGGKAICLALMLFSGANAAAASGWINVAVSSNGASVIGGVPINDGVVTGYTEGSGYSMFKWPDSMTIVLPNVYTIDKIKTLLWDGDARYYQYKLEVSEDGQTWTKVVDKTSGQWKSWQDDLFDSIPAKYIKITGTYNSANKGFHIVELEAYSSSAQAQTSTPTVTPTYTTPTPTPMLSLSPDTLSFNLGNMNFGESSSQSISISNVGSGTLTWSVVDDQPWMTLNPTAGTNSGTVDVKINTDGLSPGSYSGNIMVTSNGGNKKESIYLNILSTSPSTSVISTTAPTPITSIETPISTTAPTPITSIETPISMPPITGPPTNLVSIVAVILIVMGLVLTSLTTLKKDISLEVGVSEKSLKYVGGGGIVLIVVGVLVLLRSFWLI